MRVLVLGSGVIGVSTAWYLHRDGHEVTLIDRAPGPALETSFANGGQVSWGSGQPWAAPGIVSAAVKWLFRAYSPLVLRPRLDPAMWTWLAQFLRNSNATRFAINKERMLRLARYSHECLKQLRQDTGIRYDAQARGTLILFRTQRELDAGAEGAGLLERLGVPYQILSRAGCLAHEPALKRVADKVGGGMHFPEDESGDCRLFTQELALRAQARGVSFLPSTTVTAITPGWGRIESIQTNRGEMRADAYVLACGAYSTPLVRPLGIRLPVYPLKGYSITVPLMNEAAAPLGTLTDETRKVVITRLGSRIRAAGTAELAGYDLRIRPAREQALIHVLRELFPDSGDFARAEYWAGLRPMTPDNPPILGPTPYTNLYLNTGHGTLGWTMSTGSGRVLADLLSGRRTEIDLSGLTLDRFA